MSIKVYAPVWWDDRYLTPNSMGKFFSNDRSAYQYLEEMRKQHRNGRWLYDHYEVFVYELED